VRNIKGATNNRGRAPRLGHSPRATEGLFRYSDTDPTRTYGQSRRLVDSDLLRRFVGSTISCLLAVPLTHFHLREVFNTQEQYKSRSFLPQATVDNLLFWRNFGLKSPENLRDPWSDQPSTALYTDTSVLEPSHEATRSSAGWWVSEEVLEKIALKELKACRHGFHQNVEALRGGTVRTSFLGSTKTRSASKWSTFETKQTWWMLHHANGA
jgi:hypothetical protein